MAVRVQVVLDEEEREKFRQMAEREGLSLSAWLRQAGRERLRRNAAGRIQSRSDLDRFFQECDAREEGIEPDWEEHKKVIERSAKSGDTET